MDLYKLTIAEAVEGLKNKTFSSAEITESCLNRIDKTDGKLKALLEVSKDEALKQASAIDDKRSKGGKLSDLAGIPGTVKDVLATKGIKTTAASNILKDYVAPYDATVVARLKEAGVTVLGKNNCDAFAHGASTENSDFGPSHNPWDISRVPGGSSGGSSASVAAGQGLFSIGTDTGGSIRQPAAFCGVSAIKPTYGRCSRYGLFSMTSSTDCPSPMARTVEGLAYILKEMAGPDRFDSTAVDVKVPDYVKELSKADVKGLKIGLPKEYFSDELNPGVQTSVHKAKEVFEKLGAEVVEVSLPHTKLAIAVYYIITPSEVSSNLARYDGIRYGFSAEDAESLFEVYAASRRHGFGDEAKRRIMIGTYALSSGYYDAYYKQASKVRTLIRHDFDEVFKEVDVLLAPTSPNLAFKLGKQADDPLQMYLEDVFVSPASLAGVPALALPCGFAAPEDDDKIELPVGMQLIAPQFEESRLLQLGHKYQQETDWHMKSPQL